MHRFRSLWKTWGPWLLLALLALSLIPILMLGRYDWPSADDYSYALCTHEALLQGQCPFAASVKHIAACYEGWQGTFSAILLMTFTPLTASPLLYWLTPVVMLASLCLGTFKLADTLARRALGVSGPERLRSIVFYSFFWLVAVNLWYWLGWVRRAVLPRLAEGEALGGQLWLVVPVVLVLLAATTVGFHYWDESTSGRAAAALADGSAEFYWQQQVDRLTVLQDPSVSDVRLEPLDVSHQLKPLLYNGDAGPDPADWVNQALANFYHKNSVATTH